MPTALIAVDIQNDFCEGGALAVTGGSDVARRVADYIDVHASSFDLLVATRDWHSDSTSDHFAKEDVAPDFSTTWPKHCLAGTTGADYHPAFAGTVAGRPFVEILKGQKTAAYSGFEGTSASDPSETLNDILDQHDIDEIQIVGLATDHCVRATAQDALEYLAARGPNGKVVVLDDLTAPVSAEGGGATRAWFDSVGIVVDTSDVSG